MRIPKNNNRIVYLISPKGNRLTIDRHVWVELSSRQRAEMFDSIDAQITMDDLKHLK